jgi:hypothetical protein
VKQNDSDAEVISLDLERGRKFLRVLAEESFIALVVTADGELEIFTKGIEEDHLDRIKAVLREIVQEEE